jgi:DNA polymerase III subunit gamma/tau
MASQALYRKWRSQTFDQVVSQEHVVQTLRNALRDERVAHAYLFAGPRGTGKTSMARLLAKAVNCIGETDDKPCNVCPICNSITEGRALDLIEIDAASNRGIDEVRDLRDKVRFRPNECHYRVYILDEAHMLTTPAFNALLKTLEEPPDHAIFVLVTTEPHSIPITILSRCQRFDFRRIPLAKIVGHLERVAEEEGISITTPALELVARQATGSMRDALSLLDQLMAFRHEEITDIRVHEVLGTAPEGAMGQIVGAIADSDLASGIRALNEAMDRGAEPRQLTRDLLEYMRGVLVLVVGGGVDLLNVSAETADEMRALTGRMEADRLLTAIRAFNQAGLDLKSGMHPRLPLEMALVGAVLSAEGPAEVSSVAKEAGGVAQRPQTPARQPAGNARGGEPRPRSAVVREKAPEPQEGTRASSRGIAARQVEASARSGAELAPPAKQTGPAKPAGTSKRVGPGKPNVPEKAAAPAPESESKPTLQRDGGATHDAAWFHDNWDRVIDAVKDRNRSVVALLNGSCEPMDVDGNVLTIGFYHDFHRKMLDQDKNKGVLEAALADLTGGAMGIKCASFRGDRSKQSEQRQQEVKEKKEKKETDLNGSDPIVQEAVSRYGARVTSVRPVKE